MLPFLKKDRAPASTIIMNRKPDGEMEEKTSEEDDNSGLRSCAEDLTRAVHAKDIDAVADAIRCAFEILDSEPHEEGPHLNEDKE